MTWFGKTSGAVAAVEVENIACYIARSSVKHGF